MLQHHHKTRFTRILTGIKMLAISMLFVNCNSGEASRPAAATPSSQAQTPSATVAPATASGDENSRITQAMKQVPVICYHQVRDWKSNDNAVERTYIVPVATFKEEMQMLHDSGYHTILPGQLYAFIKNGAALPAKPIMITFDDGTISQWDNALPELNKQGFKAVFFIMTVAINRPDYLSDKQVKQLDSEGHTIGCHTWDHHNVKQYKEADWIKQLDKPTARLQTILGKPVVYFAYPFGLWDTAAVSQLKAHHYKLAFQLWAKDDEGDPLYTIRRLIADGHGNASQLSKEIQRNYHDK